MFPARMRKVTVLALMSLLIANVHALTNPYAPESTQEAVLRIADNLVAEQQGDGSWPDRGAVPSGYFTGMMAAGLVDAYLMTCTLAYKTAAESAGDWILDNTTDCSVFYDEAYALMRLSQIACDPEDNTWRTALEDFYLCVESQPPDPLYDNKEGTEAVIAQLEDVQGIPFVVLTVAHYAVAAYYVDAAEKAIWRDELIRLLEAANTPHANQVWMLGAATWALAQTGPLDGTSCYVGSTLSPYGVAESLAELPELLASYQVPSSVLYHGDHFITLYNYPNYTYSGYSETNIYAALGLAAATEYAGFDYRSEMDLLWAVNMQPVDDDGNVSFDAIEIPPVADDEKYFHYAGEYLQYLEATRLTGDLNLDDAIDLDDLMYFANQWLDIVGCSCNRADLNGDGQVDLLDFAELGRNWLRSR